MVKIQNFASTFSIKIQNGNRMPTRGPNFLVGGLDLYARTFWNFSWGRVLAFLANNLVITELMMTCSSRDFM